MNTIYPLLLCTTLYISATTASTQCDDVDSSLMPYCSSYVTYQIPYGYDQSTNDKQAEADSVPLVDQSVNCPYYDTQAYQCRKLFPRCVPSTTSNTPTTVLMCYSNCMEAQTYNNNVCGAQSQYPTSYFTAECSQTQYYSLPSVPLSDCDNYPSIASNNSNEQLILKAVLGSVFGTLALCIAVYTVYKIIKHRKLKRKLETEQVIHEARDMLRIQTIDERYEQNKERRNNNIVNNFVSIPDMPTHFIDTVVLTPSDINTALQNSILPSPIERTLEPDTVATHTDNTTGIQSNTIHTNNTV